MQAYKSIHGILFFHTVLGKVKIDIFRKLLLGVSDGCGNWQVRFLRFGEAVLRGITA